MDQSCYIHLCTNYLNPKEFNSLTVFFLLQAKMCDVKACHQPLHVGNKQSDMIIIFVKMVLTQILISFLAIYSGAEGLDKYCIT